MAEQSIQDLEQAAKYRPGAVSQIANLLTGGLYGMASGTTERAQDAATARKFLLENRMQDIQQQRMLERINRNRSESMINEIQRIDQQEEATAKRQREADERQRMKKAPEMKGFLTAQPESAIRYPGLQNLDIDTLESMYSQAKAEEAQREDAAKRNSGYIQFNVPGYGTFSGTPEKLAEMAKTNPALAEALAGKTKEPQEDYSVSVSVDPLTGEMSPRVMFKKNVTPERRREIIAEVFSGTGSKAPGAAPAPAPAPVDPNKRKKISIEGFDIEEIQ
jgi:hypothetical protein